MKVLVISSSPNTDGLTAACAQAALTGLQAAGHEAEEIRLKDYHLNLCQACGKGWGPCYVEQHCCQDDDFTALHERMLAAEGYVLVTPVYFGEPSEVLKTFLDRLRRCEHRWSGRTPRLVDRPYFAVAAAGGSGGGTVNCLNVLERWGEHLGLFKRDFIGITRYNRAYKLADIEAAGAAFRAGA